MTPKENDMEVTPQLISYLLYGAGSLLFLAGTIVAIWSLKP